MRRNHPIENYPKIHVLSRMLDKTIISCLNKKLNTNLNHALFVFII
jgi:hypothetical protein